MADRVLPGPVENSSCASGSVNIHTKKTYGSCRDKDCIEDLRVYPTASSQALINTAFSVRPKSAALLCADVRVDPVSFNRGYYTVDVTYFYKVTGNVFPGGNEIKGLAIFDKRVILFGSEGTAKVFSSERCCGRRRHFCAGEVEQPTAYVEAVDPIALSMKLADPDTTAAEAELQAIPEDIVGAIGEELVLTGACRRLYVTLGQFSIIRLERDALLTVDAKYFFPDKECAGSSEDDPCTLFSSVRFPVEEFFPPDALADETDYRHLV